MQGPRENTAQEEAFVMVDAAAEEGPRGGAAHAGPPTAQGAAPCDCSQASGGPIPAPSQEHALPLPGHSATSSQSEAAPHVAPPEHDAPKCPQDPSAQVDNSPVHAAPMCEEMQLLDVEGQGEDGVHDVAALTRHLFEQLEDCLRLYAQGKLMRAFKCVQNLQQELVRLLNTIHAPHPSGQAQQQSEQAALRVRLHRFCSALDACNEVKQLNRDVQVVHSLLHQLTRPSEWTLVDEKPHASLFYKREPDNVHHTIKVCGVINASMLDILTVINESDLLSTAMAFELSIRNSKQLPDHRQLLHASVKLPWPFDARDAVLLGSGADLLEQSKVVIFGQSIGSQDLNRERSSVLGIKSGDIPAPLDKVVRADVSSFGTLLEPLAPLQTRVSSVITFDLNIRHAASLLTFLTRHIALGGFEKFRDIVTHVAGTEFEQRRKQNKKFYGQIEKRIEEFWEDKLRKIAADVNAAKNESADAVLVSAPWNEDTDEVEQEEAQHEAQLEDDEKQKAAEFDAVLQQTLREAMSQLREGYFSPESGTSARRLDTPQQERSEERSAASPSLDAPMSLEEDILGSTGSDNAEKDLLADSDEECVLVERSVPTATTVCRPTEIKKDQVVVPSQRGGRLQPRPPDYPPPDWLVQQSRARQPSSSHPAPAAISSRGHSQPPPPPPPGPPPSRAYST